MASFLKSLLESHICLSFLLDSIKDGRKNILSFRVKKFAPVEESVKQMISVGDEPQNYRENSSPQEASRIAEALHSLKQRRGECEKEQGRTGLPGI